MSSITLGRAVRGVAYYTPDLDQILVGGDSVLVIYDEGLARSTRLG